MGVCDGWMEKEREKEREGGREREREGERERERERETYLDGWDKQFMFSAVLVPVEGNGFVD